MTDNHKPSQIGQMALFPRYFFRRLSLNSMSVRQYFTSVLAFTALIATSNFTYAREFRLVKGWQEDVCQHVLQRVSEAEVPKEKMYFVLRDLFPKTQLRQGFYFFKNEKGKSKRTVGVTEFDINNDGSDEILAFETVTFRSNDGDQLLVFKKGEVDFFSNYPAFTFEQYGDINGIRSFISWPYAEHNLYLVNIGFLTFENVNYVAIWDTRFHDPGMARAFVIARYLDSPVRNSEWATDRLDVICKIM